MRLAAIVPMRHDSERVVGKNVKPFDGLPLYVRIVEALSACPEIDRIVIDTDSPTIMADAAERFPHVALLERPAHLRDGDISMNKVLLNTAAQVEAEHYLQTHSTNPLLRGETISAAIARYFAPGDHDSLFGVTRLQTRLFFADGRAINHDPAVLLRTQDLPPVYEENSNLYLFSKQVLETTGLRIGARPILFEIDSHEAWDIDTEDDFLIAEQIWRAKHR